MNIQKFTCIKKILFLALLSICTSHSFAQNSNGIFFQAVARDNFSNPAKDRNIYVQSTIIQNTTTGTKVLIETHKSSTDAMGVFNITIGNGQRTGGTATSITAIDWSKGPFYLNLKIAITPFSASDNWDYTKELIDMGTTSFGAVPFAFYSASSAKVDDKLNATDTTKMLAVYAKAMSVKTLETSLATKLTAADTLTMLAPYAKAAYTIDSNFFRTQLATKFNAADTINYTKRKYTDSAISKKLNIADSTLYVTQSQLASYNFSGGGGTTTDTSSLSNRINLKANASDITILTNTLGSKLNLADSTKYITPTQLASYNFSGGGTTTDTNSLSNRINLKANAADVASTIAATTSSINTNTTAIGTLNTTVANNTANISSNTTAITAEATTARAAELTLTNNVTSNTVSITANATAITAEATTARAAELTLTNNINSNTASITANATAITAEATTARAAELNLTNNINSNTASITANTVLIGNLNTSVTSNITNTASNTTAIGNINTSITAHTTNIATNTSAIAAEATTARAAELTLTNNVASNTASITSNTTSINNLNTNVVSNISSINSLNTTIAAATNSNTANTIVKRDASGNFSAGTITASIYASTPIALSYTGSTINWNPILGLNAAITLTQNSVLSFTTPPAVGTYGTVVLTQDGTGSRTITLPTITSVTNKVLGSASNTTISLSTAANAKDILNFYYDGTNCYWNIGQGYGSAATAALTLTTTGTGAATLSGTTLNIPSVSSTVNSGSISGTIAVANGGTGATTLTGYIKGTGTTAMTASANIPVADVTGAAPLASPTFTGTVTTSTINTGALSASSVTTPIYASTPQALTDGATISWNPTLGLNASVTLAGNRTLSFSSTPVAGSYGTLVVTQDGTGGRTLTLPSTTNMVLGSSVSTSIALSTAANAKDILNFYYDGTNCYWNIGQGYGSAATAPFTLTTTGTGAATLSGTTLNIPAVSSTVNAGSISGTIAVANGGTGATTLTGLVKGNGSGAFTAAVAGTDYLLPTGNATTATTAGNITATSNTSLTSLSYLNTVGTITSGTISVTTNIKTSSTLTAGAVTYPNTHGTSGQVLSTTGSGTLTWTTTAVPLDASTSAKGIVQLAGDLAGTASLPTVNSIGGVSSSTIGTINTTVTAATNNNTVSAIVKRDASGNFSAGTITANLTGNVTGNLTGNATTATTASSVSGTVAIANGGTNASTAAAALTNLGAAPLVSPTFSGTPSLPTGTTAVTQTAGNNTTALATTQFVTSAITAAAVRITSDEANASAGQTVFTLSFTPLSGKVWMFVNGTRIKNGAYAVSGTTVTYTPTSNNSYTLVLNDRVQFDYAY